MSLSTKFQNIATLAASFILVLSLNAQAKKEVPDAITIKGTTARLHVSGPRPLTEALYQLSRTFHWSIGFEEAPLQYAGDLVDMTSPKYVPKSKDDRVYFPRGAPLTFSLWSP